MRTKTIQNILAENNVIIPEIQREYVWGNNTVVLKKFLEDLDKTAKEKKDINIGFLYSYQPNNEDLFLIDGQQRFTTLILLAFYCAIKENKFGEFEKLMKSHSFSYRVRSCTERFLKNLFENPKCIEKRNITKAIQNAKWFLPNKYNHDVSIKAMLSTFNIIEEFVEGKKSKSITYDFIIDKIYFWYFNIKETSQGEELYITMNSRGESLTNAEQIKPLLFERISDPKEKLKYGKKWDDWEESFYELKGDKDIKTVDLIMDRFIQIILQLENSNNKKIIEFSPEEKQKINLQIIENYFIALQYIAKSPQRKTLSCLYDEKQEEKSLFPFITILYAAYRKPDISDEELLRIYNTIRNAVRRGIIEQKQLVTLLKKYNREPFYDYILALNKDELYNKFLDKHEIKKIELINENENKTIIEKEFWRVQNHNIWNGEITPLLDWSTVDREFKFEKFIKYNNLFSSIFNGECKNEELDITRRALLTRELNGYPRKFKGYTNTSFCWECSDWKTLIDENKDNFKLFLDELADNTNLIQKQEEMIKTFDHNKEWAEFVEQKELLEFCMNKNIQWHNEKGWALIKQIKATRYANLKSYHLYLDLKKDNFTENKNWELSFYEFEETCACLDKKDINSTTINVFYTGDDKYELHLFCSKDGKITKEALKQEAAILEFDFISDHYSSEKLSREEILDLTKKAVELFSK